LAVLCLFLPVLWPS